ncbi:MAG TPA: glycosyltransferase family 4 protein, partial [Acholeplasmataceae bacterium]|nr:glycosyltransferase family 4 protein [Acholeplasmataceae bacterium]
EGLSLSLMEAMAAGLPIVCSKIRGNTDLVDEGKGGYLVQPNGINDISKKIISILTCGNGIELGHYNTKKINKFDKKFILSLMIRVYMDEQK